MQEPPLQTEQENWPHDPATFYERRREREFYKYYEPFRVLRTQTQPPLVDFTDEEASQNHRPASSPDTTLTAFCQLGALRLRTRRCMLLFFDTEYAYILAEATQTLSLQDDDVHDDADGLWLGNTIIPRGFSICEHTVNIPQANKGSNQSNSTAGEVHVINNLSDDVRFCDRPFVTTGPKCRFYAGVPIRTPVGLSIGTFCALDDKPRNGLTDKESEFMRQMSRNVIDHFETVRAKAEYGRGSRMMTSLGKFFKSVPTAGQPKLDTSSVLARRKRSAKQTPTIRSSSHKSTSSQGTEADPVLQGTVKDPSSPSIGDGNTDVKDFAAPSPTTAEARNAQATGTITRRSDDVDDELTNALEDSIQDTFQIAAELIRSAADADSVIFLDMKRHNTQRRVQRSSRRTSQYGQKDRVGSDTDGTSTDGGYLTDSDNSTSNSQGCPIFGQSRRSETTQHSKRQYPRKIIKFLLRRYTSGKIWNFNSDGYAGAPDSVSDATEVSDDTLESSTISEGLEERALSVPQRRAIREREYIQQLFPGVRALFFVPLWDPTKERLYAVAMVTTDSPHRVLSVEGDFSFVRAFCDVVMASIGRLESSIEEQAKTQFISSISHELRSPLHGILGGIDFLNSHERPDKSILSQIEKCSITLVDIIEHLLEYAKINNLSKDQTLLPGQTDQNKESSAFISAQQAPPGIALAELTEDVADAVFYSHSYAFEEKTEAVSYIFDCTLDPLWQSSISVGAWKRLCMNIINNALKYTDKGHIRVSLSLSEEDGAGPAAVLTVADTGVGMSRDFLEYGLFRAFKQENSLTPGTGLGMSLVAKLIKSIGGDVVVSSKKHVGTSVQLTVPLAKQKLSEDQPDRRFWATSAAIYHPSPAEQGPTHKLRAKELQVDALQHHCSMQGILFPSEDSTTLFIFQSDLLMASTEVRAQLFANIKILLVLCDSTYAAAKVAAVKELENSGVSVICITQPFGANKIARALAECSTQHEGSPLTTNVIADSTVHETDAADSLSLTLATRPKVLFEKRNSSYVLHNRAGRAKSFAEAQPDSTPSKANSPTEEGPLNDSMLPGMIDGNVKNNLALLLVDDNDINLRILQMYAKQKKHPYMTAVNGREAVSAYKTAFQMHETADGEASKIYADVIFMDINMPVMSGFEATRQIRAYERSQDLQPAIIIALTGLGSSEAQEQATSSGIDLFLTKPVRAKELTRILESMAAEIAARKPQEI